MSPSPPLVSVVIPCYNVSAYIRKAAHSALSQEEVEVEVVCVDNNSTDETPGILDELKAQSARIHVLSEHTKGACAARNAGLAVARGEFVQFLDADDELMPHKIQRQLEAAQRNRWDIVVSGYSRISISGIQSTVPVESDPWKGLFVTRLGQTSSMLFRRSALLKCGGWNVSLGSSQEYELIFRMLASGSTCGVADYPDDTRVHEREGQISRSDPRLRWERYLRLRLDILAFLKANRPDYWNTEKAYFQARLFDVIRIVYPHCPELALDAFRKELTDKFRPDLSPATGRVYLLMYRLLGFRGAEYVRAIFRK